MASYSPFYTAKNHEKSWKTSKSEKSRLTWKFSDEENSKLKSEKMKVEGRKRVGGPKENAPSQVVEDKYLMLIGQNLKRESSNQDTCRLFFITIS